MKSRKRLFLAVVAIAVAFGAAGYVLGQQLESPEDARAEVAAPDASLIAVPVELKQLSNDVVVGGNAEFEGALDLQLDPTLGDGASRVVTGRVPEVDTEVNEGDVVIEVSTRPVFILEGALPAFREFKPGVEGDDVLQLEEALQRLGFLDVEPDRLYGQATEDAIAAMYEEAGYEARNASVAEEAQIEAAERTVESARTGLADANDALSDLLSPPTQAQQIGDAQTRQGLVDAIDDAQEAFDEVEADRPSNDVLRAIDTLRQAELSNDPASVDEANRTVLAAQEAEQASVDAAEDQLERAEAALRQYDDVEAAIDRDGTDTSGAQRQIDDSADRLEEAEAQLAELQEDIGVRFPAAEVVFLADLPRTVTAVDVERGDPVTASVMRISGTEVRITTGVSDSNRPLLEVGQRVIIDSEELDIEVEGEITELADRKGTKGVADTRFYMEVTPTGDFNVSQLVGVFFQMQIPLERTEGDVLAVPLAAVSGAGGNARLQVERSDGSTDLVEVEVGLQDRNGSLVEVTPVAGSLSEGDLVVIDVEQAAPAPETESEPESEADAESEPESEADAESEDDGG